MGKQKQNLVKIVAPETLSSTSPMVVSFGHWRAEDLPKQVIVEVVEIDRDNVNDENMTSSEDSIAVFSGTLVAAPDESARLETPVLSTLTSPSRSPDRVFLKFADSDVVVEAGIPFSPAIAGKKTKKGRTKGGKPAEHSANEGSFYEIAARVKDAGSGTEIAISDATTVRQKVDLLLAVEPLSQVSSGMNHPAGKKILSAFHPGREKDFDKRDWGSLVLRLRNHSPMTAGGAGCSYVIMTMVLRYLRVDAPDDPVTPGAEALVPADKKGGGTIRLFDKHIVKSELEKHPEHKPRFFKGDAPFNPGIVNEIPAARWMKEREGFFVHFLDAAAKEKGRPLKTSEKKALGKKLGKFFDKKTEGRGDKVKDGPASEENIDESTFYHPATREITDNEFVPLLVWRLHVLDDRKDNYKMQRTPLSQYRLKLEGASDYRTLAHDAYESWEPAYDEEPLMHDGKRLELLDHMSAGVRGKSVMNDQGILVPLSSAFENLFGLVDTAPKTNVAEFPADQPGDAELTPWQRFVVATLDRGLPVVGLFSPGQYSTREQGGHFCLIVGYRFMQHPDDPTKKKIRFVLNDPAGAQATQYEAHDEDELNPPGVEPTKQLKPGDSGGMGRERSGLNLAIEHRKRLSLRQVYVFEPTAGGKSKTSVWDPARHARFLFFKGRVQKQAND